MSALVFYVPGTPVPQGSKRAVRGRLIDDNPGRLRPWREAVAWRAHEAMPAGWSPVGAFRLEVRFYLPRPKFHYRPDGSLRARWEDAEHTTRPDLDKLTRAVGDALTDAGVWRDDSQLVRLVAEKFYAGPGLPVGAHIEVWRGWMAEISSDADHIVHVEGGAG